MLWAIVVVLLLLWGAGIVMAYTLGGLIHVLLGVAVVVVLVRALRR
jgi:hypothetical protein